MKSLGIVLVSLFLTVGANAQNGGVRKTVAQVNPRDAAMEKNKEVVTEAKGAIKKAKVFFIEPKEGSTVTSPVKIKMGVEGMTIRKAGEAVDDMTSGHHHVILDGNPIPAGQPIPMDEKHIHFGQGQTETEIKLAPGEHTLTLQFADGAHRSFGPALSQTIKFKVKGK